MVIKSAANASREPSILCPMDYSEDARHAFDLACRLAGAFGAKVRLLHVVPRARRGMGMAPDVPLSMGYRGAWESRLRMLQPADPRTHIEHMLAEGDAAEEIVNLARETACGLIVMGPDRRTGLTGLFHTSVTENVQRKASCPVVTVAAHAHSLPKLRLNTIVHPTDFSPHADHAFDLARSLARSTGGELFLIHVTTHALLMKQAYRDEIEKTLKRMTQADPTVRMHSVLMSGDPVSVTLRIAQNVASDLIVIGTHGRSGLNRLWHGSVARHIQRESPCAVATIKLPSEAGRFVPLLGDQRREGAVLSREALPADSATV
jgi:nucleotide-binding universal stress UspA family protein